MNPRLRTVALFCMPLFLAGLFVSIRSHWRPTELLFAARSTGWRITANAALAFIATTGKRNSEPAAARSTLALKGLTVPSSNKAPEAPKASADRSIVPKLPGS